MCGTRTEADLDTGRTGHRGTGRHWRKSLSIHAMARMFSTERKARLWLESARGQIALGIIVYKPQKF